jgi:hypothetical protein
MPHVSFYCSAVAVDTSTRFGFEVDHFGLDARLAVER